MTDRDFLSGLFTTHFPSVHRCFLSEKQRPCATVSLEVVSTTVRTSLSHTHTRTRTSTPTFHSCSPPRRVICSPFCSKESALRCFPVSITFRETIVLLFWSEDSVLHWETRHTTGTCCSPKFGFFWSWPQTTVSLAAIYTHSHPADRCSHVTHTNALWNCFFSFTAHTLGH